jgi:ribokinase
MSRIVVLGSMNMDMVVNVPSLPAPGETVIGDRLDTFPGGKGANQAVASARLGGDVAMVGRVGNDAFGDELLAQLKASNVDVSGVVRDAGYRSGVATIMVDATGQNLIAVASGANGAVGNSDVDRALGALGRDGLLLLQMEVPVNTVRRAIAAGRSTGARVLLNAAPSTRVGLDLVHGVDILVCNEPEANAVFGRQITDDQDAVKVARLGADSGIAITVITLGSAGSVVCAGSECQVIAPFPVQAVDSTAAGDAFVGAFAVALSRRVDPFEAARLASAAGAAAATKPGAQSSMPMPSDLQRLFGIDWESALG